MNFFSEYISDMRKKKEKARVAAFCAEFDRRRALVENDPNLSDFEREWVADSTKNLPAIRSYMATKNTWLLPFPLAFK